MKSMKRDVYIDRWLFVDQCFTSVWLIPYLSAWRLLCLAGLCQCGPVAIMIGCSSCRHKWRLSDLNPGPAGYKPITLAIKPLLLSIIIIVIVIIIFIVNYTILAFFTAWSTLLSPSSLIFFYIVIIVIEFTSTIIIPLWCSLAILNYY